MTTRVLAISCVLLACTDQLGNAADGGSDVASDVANDIASDVNGPMDAAQDVVSQDAGDAGTVYNDIKDTTKWSTFNMTTGTEQFAGSVFDGRYVYFIPAVGASVFARYDTTASFTSSMSWQTFDLTMVNGGLGDFAGGAFDGRYVYLAPHGSPLIVQYDTTMSFTATTSYAVYDDTTVLGTGTANFQSATFDGSYVYFFSYFCCSNALPGYVLRYAVSSSFTANGSWTNFTATGVSNSARGFAGGVFDGRYLYIVPYTIGIPSNTGLDGVVPRYDTLAAFTNNASWTTFDVTGNVDPNAKGFTGGVFDGRYLYLVPNFNGTYDGVVAQYDTQAAFAKSSWATFDVATNVNSQAAGFATGAFDGRYVYFVPYNASTLARFDTLAPVDGGVGAFVSKSAWSVFDTSGINANAKQFYGAAFDGRYVYFIPAVNGVAARFDARTASALPPGPAHGSFF